MPQLKITVRKIEDLPFDCWQGHAAFLSSKAPRHGIVLLQPPVNGVTRASTLGVQRPGWGFERVSPFHATAKNEWDYTLTLPHAFMMCNIVDVLHYTFYTLHQAWVIAYYVRQEMALYLQVVRQLLIIRNKWNYRGSEMYTNFIIDNKLRKNTTKRDWRLLFYSMWLWRLPTKQTEKFFQNVGI